MNRDYPNTNACQGRINAIAVSLLVINFFLLLKVSFQKWGDIWIDYGREVYTAWQLSEGGVLYSSVDSIFGPLAHYINSLVFLFFGAGILKLALWSIVLIVLFSIAIYRFFRHYANWQTAFFSVAVFQTVFAFSQYTFMGSLNFVCPYSHALTYGVILATAGCFSLCRFHETSNKLHLLSAAFFCGLTFLTKAEVFLAAGIACCAGFILSELSHRKSLQKIIAESLVCISVFCVPFIISLLLLRTAMSWNAALEGILGQYIFLFKKGVPASDYYSGIMGLTNFRFNVLNMLKHFGAYIAVIVLFSSPAFLYSKASAMRRIIPALVLSAISIYVAFTKAIFVVDWPSALRGLPIILLCALVVYSWRSLALLRKSEIIAPEIFSLLILTLFSMLLLLKVFFNVWLGHYAFALSVPGTLVMCALILCEIPKRVVDAATKRMLNFGLGMLVVLTLVGFARNSAFVYAAKSYPVSSGLDTMYDYPPAYFSRGFVLNAAIDFVENKMPREKSFTVLPATPMLNYLTRRVSPFKYTELNMAEFSFYGDGVVASELQAAHPDYIFLHKIYDFGRAYGIETMGSIDKYYEPVALLGFETKPQTLRDDFWMVILRRSK